ncbi:MAG: response regulator [Chthoniobacter sp.]|uniref:response regulator n=1 Tax=Chthoniobacter sp. TaxID=2510640 RepID=UPI0032AC786D
MRILVADDEPFIADLLAMLLKARGHSAKTVLDGQAALDAFRGEPFDLVITDLSMPKINGLILAREIKALNPSQPIALLTGSTDDSVTHPHIDFLLAKPVELARLTAVLAQVESQRK